MLVNYRFFVFFVFLVHCSYQSVASKLFQADDSWNSTSLKNKALLYSNASKPDSAILFFKKALELSDDTDSTLKIMLLLGEEYRLSSYIDLALNIVHQAERISVESEFTDSTINYELLHLKAKIFTNNGKYLEALPLFDSAISMIEGMYGSFSIRLIKVLNFKGITCYYLGNQKQALDNYHRALQIALDEDVFNIDLADIYQNIAILHSYKGEFDSAFIYLTESKEIREKLFPDDDPIMSGFYINYGRILSMVGDMNNAYSYYKKAENIMNKHAMDDDIWWGHLQVNIGSYLQLRNDFEKALVYYLNAHQIYKRIYEPSHALNVTVANNLANIYNQLGNFEKARQISAEALEKAKSPITKVQLMRGLARSLAGLGEEDRAVFYFQQAITVSSKELGDNHFETANSHVILADFYMQHAAYRDAFEHYGFSNRIFEQIFGKGDTELADVLLKQAICKVYLAEFEAALEFITAAESNLLINSSSANTDVSGSNSLINIRLVDVYFWWGSLYNQWYDHQPDQENLLKSMAYFDKAAILFDQIGLFITDESRMILNKDVRSKLYEAIVVAEKLHKITEEDEYVDKAFYYAEKSRASVLLSSIRKSEAMQLSGINDSIANREFALREDLSLIQKLIYEEQQKSFPNNFRVAFLEKRQLQLMQDIDQLVTFIQANYSDYNRLAFNTDVLSLPDIQQNLQANETMIAYVLGDEEAYAIVADQDEKHLVKLISSDTILQLTDGLLKQLQTDFSQHSGADFMAYKHSAHNLYNALLADLIPFIHHKKLVVIPDGRLGYLPFELLIVNNGKEQGRIDYRSLDYLIYDYAISYLYSATLGFDKVTEKRSGNGKLLAMVPDYSNFKTVKREGNQSFELSELPFAQTESEAVLKKIDGTLAMGEEATKTRFLKDASAYSVLHLAMHTVIDDENPMYSRLIFQQIGDSLDYYSLGTYELFGLRLNASMAVLSACNTGSGKLRQGEGIMSLTRGFIHSGVPSIVMTNWEVHDQTGAWLMERFYEYLSQGMEKDMAMQKAKIEFLQQANQLKAHPYFWASYVIIGDTEPLSLSGSNRYMILFLSAFILVMVVVFLVFRKQSKKRT
ncbi:MAG: CHAT domain-containing protein [Bacteroidetes bacterium]|nr:CHAT domain-containing protein [Bacteroidota bacterium]